MDYSQDHPTHIKRQRLHIEEGEYDGVLLHSDTRKQLIFAKCKLCFEERVLQLSHIAPKWAYQWAKAEGRMIANIRSKGIIGRADDGEKHYLLCSDCEQSLGKAEKYLSTICKGTKSDLDAIDVALEPGPILRGVDYEMIMTAFLGILYKGHFAPSNPWEHISLPVPVLKRINRFLRRGDVRAVKNFHLVATRWVSFRIPDVNPKAMMTPAISYDGNRIYIQLLLGGWSWIMFLPKGRGKFGIRRISREVHIPARRVKHITLRRDEPWRVLQGEIFDCVIVESKRKMDGEYEIPDYKTLQKCYCGLDGKMYPDCCMNRWFYLSREGKEGS